MVLILLVLSLMIRVAFADAQLSTYTTACESESEPQFNRVEGLLLPYNAGHEVNVNFYFPGWNWDNGPIGKYVEKMGLLEAVTSQSPSGEVMVIFAGGNNHKDTAKQWMSGKRKNTQETQFNCFYQEALNKVVGFGFNPQSISFLGHSNGVHVIKNIMDSGFLDEGGILPIKDIISFDGCYGEWCTEIASQLQEKGGITGKYYAYYLKDGDTESNSKALLKDYSPSSLVFEIEASKINHLNVPQECLFSHLISGDNCGGKAGPIISPSTAKGPTEATSASAIPPAPSSPSSSTFTSPELPGNFNRQTEIDQVWKVIGPSIRGSTEIWDIVKGWIKYEDAYPSPSLLQPGVPSSELCFPLEPNSFKENRDNFGNKRSLNGVEGKRCHAGIDLLAQGEYKVVAVADGEVTSINPSFVDPNEGCGTTGAAALFIYHPSLGQTINYGEIFPADANKYSPSIQVKKGQFLGRASPCEMLHFELYNGKVDTNAQWLPPNGQIATNDKNDCRTRFISTKPATLLDPTYFINLLTGKYCSATSS